ncbi:MAG: CRISPR-associated helicase Cas3', partial [Planctomycetia bacterium]|nr:CRISPR-associated helicase Cas3' [Planctomycetia bacterium]
MSKLFARKGEFLGQHLKEVSSRAAAFSEVFGSGEFGRFAGLLHDIGKTEAVFQKRILDDDQGNENKRPHAFHGAALALGGNLWPAAFAIGGHHAGLHDRSDLEKKARPMFGQAEASVQSLQQDSPEFQIPSLAKPLPEWLMTLAFSPAYRSEGWWATELFTRLIFSCLVDADRLVSELAEQGSPATVARRWPDFNPAEMLDKLRSNLEVRAKKARADESASAEVITVREQVGGRCETVAEEALGIFTLTVPTGGGKTLASMRFALAHAKKHGLRRVIYVIPYLNIIQQTAEDLKKVFGEGMVLEHHSQMEDGDAETKDDRGPEPVDELSRRRRLAAENWDAPIIVTTSVQFFDSLFSRQPSAARKLHNICKSVVIFDEVQTLPPLMLQPILNALGELANPSRKYGCSLVFCTATQPALRKSEDLPVGLVIDDARAIIEPQMAKDHFARLDRVEYDWSLADSAPLKWSEVAKKIVGEDSQPRQVLVIVNTRNAARQLHVEVGKLLEGRGGLFHLSTWMMPTHRLEVLDEVRCRLDPKSNAKDRRCILVSTQCVEAGVDVDFPQVWREFGPYDGIVQAAGRCNRNGRLPQKGKVHIF